MKRCLVLLFTLISLLTFLTLGIHAASAPTSGTCGENLTWSYNNDVLTISGTGTMQNYHKNSPSPWSELDITKVVIKDGVASIGRYAFYNQWSISTLTLPASVKKINESAFEMCLNLTDVVFPEGLEELWDNSFAYCSSLTEVVLPDSLTLLRSPFHDCYSLERVVIGDSLENLHGYAFSNCDQLSDVTLGINLKELGGYAFQGCRALTEIYLPDTLESILNNTFANSGLSNQSSETLVVSREIGILILVPYVFSLVFALMSRNKGNFLFRLPRPPYQAVLRKFVSLPS